MYLLFTYSEMYLLYGGHSFIFGRFVTQKYYPRTIINCSGLVIDNYFVLVLENLTLMQLAVDIKIYISA